MKHYSAVVVGGGFYGCALALYLKQKKKFSQVRLIEKETELLKRASYNNQARVHNGYHYPRSFTTAYRSRINFPQFLGDFSGSIDKTFTKMYAVARQHSKVNAKQYARFCHQIGAAIKKPTPQEQALFNSHWVEELFVVDEAAFDANALRSHFQQKLSENEIEVNLQTTVSHIACGEKFILRVGNEEISADYVLNCTYSGLNHVSADITLQTQIKQEMTEMALVEVPEELKKYGLTVMDGPFFSLMPFPAEKLFSLSHVRYTPHFQWLDSQETNPYRAMQEYEFVTRFERMKRDAMRFVPKISEVVYKKSLLEVKTVLVHNEVDDGRPILFEKNQKHPRFISILGGKIDNIYDIVEKLDREIS
jgi:glycine/D-amino acid oxidase-like deaminating enzyme